MAFNSNPIPSVYNAAGEVLVIQNPFTGTFASASEISPVTVIKDDDGKSTIDLKNAGSACEISKSTKVDGNLTVTGIVLDKNGANTINPLNDANQCEVYGTLKVSGDLIVDGVHTETKVQDLIIEDASIQLSSGNSGDLTDPLIVFGTYKPAETTTYDVMFSDMSDGHRFKTAKTTVIPASTVAGFTLSDFQAGDVKANSLTLMAGTTSNYAAISANATMPASLSFSMPASFGTASSVVLCSSSGALSCDTVIPSYLDQSVKIGASPTFAGVAISSGTYSHLLQTAALTGNRTITLPATYASGLLRSDSSGNLSCDTTSYLISDASASVLSLTSSGTMSCGTNSMTCGAMSVTSLTSSGTMSCGTNAMTCGAMTCGAISATGSINSGTNPMTCGAMTCGSIAATGSINAGTYAMTCGSINTGIRSINCGSINSSGSIGNSPNGIVTGTVSLQLLNVGTSGISGAGRAMSIGAITSDGTFTCGTYSMTCGALSSGAITSTGTVSCGTNSMTCGAMSVTSLTSSGTMSCGTNSMTCGALSASGTISCGTNSMTCGAMSVTSLTSSGTMSCGTNSMTSGALSVTSLTSSGTMSCGTNAMTCGALSSGAITSSGAVTGTSLAIASGTWSNTITTAALSANKTLTLPATYAIGYLRSDASGNVSILEHGYYDAKLWHDTNYIVPTGTPGQMSLNSKSAGQAPMIATDYQITCTKQGMYIVGFNGYFEQNASGQREIQVKRVRSGNTEEICGQTNSGAPNYAIHMSCCTVIDLQVNDYVYAYCAQNCGGNLNFYTTSGLYVTLTGPY